MFVAPVSTSHHSRERRRRSWCRSDRCETRCKW